MISAEKIAAYLAEAERRLGIHEQGGENRGPEVEKYLASVGLAPGNPWCLAFAYDTGKTAVPSWSLLATGSCYELGEWSRSRGVRYLEPQRGDIGLLWHPELKRFGHAVIVVDVDQTQHFKTIEGNSNEDGSREGFEVDRHTRPVHPNDRFVRWVELGS